MDADVVGLDPALGEQFLDVAVGPPEAQVPADREDDDVWGKRNPRGGPRGGSRMRAASSHTGSLTGQIRSPPMHSARRLAPPGAPRRAVPGRSFGQAR